MHNFHKRFFIATVLSSVVIPTSLAQSGLAQPTSSAVPMNAVAPKAGEIMLEGTIVTIDIPWQKDTATLTLKTTAFATPGKAIRPLPAAKDKPVTFSYSKANLQFATGAPQPVRRIPNAVDVLGVGQKVRVIGQDRGTGSTLNATLLATEWKGNGQVIEGATRPGPRQYGHGMKGDFGVSGTRTVAFSNDGKLMATASDWPEQTVKVWDMESGKVLHEFVYEWHGEWLVNVMYFAPDNKTLIAQAGRKSEEDPDSFFLLWDTVAERYRIIRNDDGRVLLSPNGEILASSSGGKFFDLTGTGKLDGAEPRVRLLRSEDGSVIHDLTEPSAINFKSTQFSQDGKLLYTLGDGEKKGQNSKIYPPVNKVISDPQNLRIWDVETGRVIRSMPFGGSELYRIGTTDRFRIRRRIPGQDIKLSEHLYLGTFEFEDWKIDGPTTEKVNTIKIPAEVLGVQGWESYSSPDGELICFRVNAGGENNTSHLQFLKVADGSIVKSPTYSGRRTFSGPSFTPDGKFFAVTEVDNGVTLFDVATGKQARTITLPMKPEKTVG